MKAVLISIQPKWCELIANGKKTVEVRKTKPKLETPFKCYIYETKTPLRWNKAHNNIIGGEGGYVIGEFMCNNIDNHCLSNLVVKEDAEHTLNGTCLTKEEVLDYLGYQKGTSIYACKNYDFYGWHISDLVIYDKPRKLSEFYRECEKPECEDCPYLHFENTPNSYEGWCEFDEKIPIKRPPQSWCYVESEVQGE